MSGKLRNPQWGTAPSMFIPGTVPAPRKTPNEPANEPTNEPTTEAGRRLRRLYGQVAVEDILAIESEARATAPAGLDRWLHTSDGHPSALDIAAILEALGTTRRLRGLWVQYHGDGTGRARRKGDVVVSCQWDRGWGIAHATDATDGSVRDASRALAARLRDPAALAADSEPDR